MQRGDYDASFFQYPHLKISNANPSPIPNSNPNLMMDHYHQTSSYASAPPFNTGYSPSDYSIYHPNYSNYPQNPDPIPPPTAPSYPPTATTAPPTPQPPPPPANPNILQPLFDPSSQLPQSQPSFPPYDSHGPYNPSISWQSYCSPFDQHQTAPSYGNPSPATSSIPPNPVQPSANPPYSSMYSAPYNQLGSTAPPSYGSPYENSPRFDQSNSYFDDKLGSYGRNRSDLGSDLYGKRTEGGYDFGRDDGYEDGVYAYDGGKVEPYGARGTAPKSSTWSGFDDYGRAISFPSVKDSSVGLGSSSGSAKIVRAVPKPETQQDVKGGVLKFRVKLLAENPGLTTMDVLCQIGLDGVRMLDPSTGRTLRIYPLENITRCEVTDPSTLAFWSKSSVDIEPRRIRLQSNSYTTTTLLDTVTAATVQVKEMAGASRPSDSPRTTEQLTDKKKGLVDWMNIIKPSNEEKDHWVPDEAVTKCTACGTDFGAFVRKHHCRNCGDIFCDKCTHGRIALTSDENAQPVRVCDRCMAEVTQRLSNSKEATTKPAGLRSHEDLAKKLQDEMEKNRKASSGNLVD
uniref:JHL20J20.9 protein n=1 Tax=Rhizophora mucronata TaxID=61149 RepID=A0A2P2L391_RHIMU